MSRTALRVALLCGFFCLLSFCTGTSQSTESSVRSDGWNACKEGERGDSRAPPSDEVKGETNGQTSTSRFVQDDSDGEVVESALIPGMSLPPEVERSLAGLLSRDTVQWIDEEEAKGRGSEGGSFNGRYIPVDMKQVIRDFVNLRFPESPDDSLSTAAAAPTIDQSRTVYDHGTDVGSPCADQKRRALDFDCRVRRAPASRGRFIVFLQNRVRQFVDGILKKEVILLFVVVTMIVLSLSALLFVYGVSDVCSGILSSCEAMTAALKRIRIGGMVRHGEHLGDGAAQTSSNGAEKPLTRQTAAAAAKHNTRSKAKDTSSGGGGGGKTTSKRKNKTHATTKQKSEVAVTENSNNSHTSSSGNSGSGSSSSNTSSAKKESKKAKKATARNSVEVKDRRAESDKNNDWQEVMHNKPKGKSTRTKQHPEEEEKSLPQIKVPAKTPSPQSESAPSTPSPPTRPTPAASAQESEPDAREKQQKFEQEDPSFSPPVECRNAVEESNSCLRVNLALPSVFSDVKDSYSSSNAYDASPLRCTGESQFLPQPQQSPAQRSPFASSTDLPPFGNNSPVTAPNVFPARPQTAEEQFQSKIDCLLRNLRNKPFSVHPVTRSQHQPLRRAVTDMDEHMAACRMNSFNLQYPLSGSQDTSCTSSGTLNNRVSLYQPSMVDDAFLGQRLNGGNGGLTSRHAKLMQRQRAGSLPLTPQQSSSQPFFLGHNQGSAKTPSAVNAHQLSNDCSLFSSNPSIWSVDLAVDRNLVKSSMSSSTGFSPPVSAPTSSSAAQNIDFKRCLPDQLLSEVGSFPNP